MSADEPTKRERGPRFALAAGSAGLAALGLGLVAKDVIGESKSGAGWLPLVAGVAGLVAAGVWSAIDDAREVKVDRSPDDVVEGGGDRPRVLRWIVLAASLILLAQALIPLRYYLGHDPYDERFAWRMFSDIRMQRCQVTATEVVDGQSRPVPLVRNIHMAWINTLKRNRSAVVQRYLRWRCEQEGVTQAELSSRCVTPEGRTVPPLVRTIDCSSGEIEGALQ